jgi:hypothetical protein
VELPVIAAEVAMIVAMPWLMLVAIPPAATPATTGNDDAQTAEDVKFVLDPLL